MLLFFIVFWFLLIRKKKDLNIVFGDKKYEMDMVYFLVNLMIKDRFKYLSSRLMVI